MFCFSPSKTRKADHQPSTSTTIADFEKRLSSIEKTMQGMAKSYTEREPSVDLDAVLRPKCRLPKRVPQLAIVQTLRGFGKAVLRRRPRWPHVQRFALLDVYFHVSLMYSPTFPHFRRNEELWNFQKHGPWCPAHPFCLNLQAGKRQEVQLICNCHIM